MKALLIQFNVETGRRPKGVDPNDPKLQCYGWQNLDVRPAIEIRVIEDDRDITQYERREDEGLTVLYDDNEVDTAIEQYIPTRLSIDNEPLFKFDLEQRRVKLSDIPGNTNDILKCLKDQGIKGVRDVKPLKIADVYSVK